MDTQNDGGAENKEINSPNNAITPIAHSANPQTTKILIPSINSPPHGNLFRRHWKWFTLGGLIAFAALITIPNSLMDMPLKWGELFGKRSATTHVGGFVWTPPALSNGCQQVTVFCGVPDQIIPVNALTNGRTRFQPEGIELAYLFVSNNTLFADVTVNTGKKPIEIRSGHVSHLPDGWDCNRNSNRFEIVNADGWPVYQCRYWPDKVEMEGSLVGSGLVIAATRSGVRTTPIEFNPLELGLTRIFLYPSKDNLGRLAEK